MLRQSKIVENNYTGMLRRLFPKTIIIFIFYYIYQNKKKIKSTIKNPNKVNEQVLSNDKRYRKIIKSCFIRQNIYVIVVVIIFVVHNTTVRK